jgi:poly(beta-D-mannuronate) lyase
MNQSAECFFYNILPLRFLAVLFFMLSSVGHAAEYLVASQEEYRRVAADLHPGDTVLLKNGEWRDFEIVFSSRGTKDRPVSLKAETPGQVFLTGQSNLALGGQYLFVSGLVFKQGYTPTDSVISYRVTPDQLAHNSRVTNVVIDNYSQPERYETDYWVALYGKNNRFDHSHLIGKNNKGVTLAVRMDRPESRQNRHVIDHNYFGPREVLGSNGGETLRIGTSHYSLEDSLTLVENNVFDRCDGELEIISVKSGGNIIRGNLFLESRGTLTLRHGNDNVLENNTFFGNNVDHTGGIRVINKRQTIRNNYFEGLKGYRFGGALVIMNGVPNSPINRYHQVDGAQISNNSFVNVEHINLGAGSDFERSAVPINSHFTNNFIVGEPAKNIFTLFDDILGIEFTNNVSNSFQSVPGFSLQDEDLERTSSGILYSPEIASKGIGFNPETPVVSLADVGVPWYPKASSQALFKVGKRIAVHDEKSFSIAINSASSGDVIDMAPGDYRFKKIIPIRVPITIAGKGEVNISFERSALFEIKDGGSLQLVGLNISGIHAPDNVGNAVIRTSPYAMLHNYQLDISNTQFRDLNINRYFNVLSVSKSTMADSIRLNNVNVINVSGAVLALDKENDDFGIFNADYVYIESSTFVDVEGPLLSFYRGGTDESTFGPHLYLANSTLTNVGLGQRNKNRASVFLHGVQVSQIINNDFINSGTVLIEHTVGEPVTSVSLNLFEETPAPILKELYSKKPSTSKFEKNRFISTQ